MDRDHAYDDIISLDRPPSPGHPPLSRESRAAQFSPFAALTGFEDAIEETARWTDSRLDPGEEDVKRLNEQLRLLKEREGERPFVRLTVFQADEKKDGGRYVTLRERLKRVQEDEGRLLLENGQWVAFSDLLEAEIEETESKET
jgi:hypothetical protein